MKREVSKKTSYWFWIAAIVMALIIGIIIGSIINSLGVRYAPRSSEEPPFTEGDFDPECEEDSDCNNEFEVCEEGSCECGYGGSFPCGDFDCCGENEVCDSTDGICKECSESSDCPPGYYCSSGICENTCNQIPDLFNNNCDRCVAQCSCEFGSNGNEEDFIPCLSNCECESFPIDSSAVI